jgi:hypothetical protein
MRSSPKVMFCAAAAMASAVASVSLAQVPVERNDVLYGANRSGAADSVHQVRGFPTGTRLSSAWSASFMQSLQLDNMDGFQHAHFGNLLGVNFGTTAAGGSIFNLETRFTGGTNPGAAQPLFDFATYNAANPSAPLAISRLNGMSVSPANNRMAITGGDTGNTYVFDYTPGNGQGAGGVLANGREITNMATAVNGASAWLNNDNVLVLDPLGVLKQVTIGAGGALTSANVANFTIGGSGTNPFASLAYEPTLSPYVFASVGRFDAGTATTTNTLLVLDPGNNFSVVRQLDYSTSVNTFREIAFDSKGNLYVGQAMNTTTQPPGVSVEVLLNATDVNGLQDNVSTDYYTQPAGFLTSSFSGLDVAATLLDYKSSGVTVNLRDRSHVQRYFGANPATAVRAKVQAGYNGGAWNGAGGILSSNAAAQPGYAVGYGDAADLGLVGGTFGGETVDGNAILFRLTRYGDANLDGNVNLTDFNRLASNFGGSNSVWTRGDFNYDGLVNLTDFNLLAANFGLQASGPEVTPEDWSNLAAAIPEPSSLALLGLAATSLVRRRRA